MKLEDMVLAAGERKLLSVTDEDWPVLWQFDPERGTWRDNDWAVQIRCHGDDSYELTGVRAECDPFPLMPLADALVEAHAAIDVFYKSEFA